MASRPITSWQIDGQIMKTVIDFIFMGSKGTADGDYSCEIKRCLHLRREAMMNLDSRVKSRHHYADKGPQSQSYDFFRSESWTIKKAECQRIDAFELWCLRRFLSPLDSKEIKFVNPKGNQP